MKDLRDYRPLRTYEQQQQQYEILARNTRNATMKEERTTTTTEALLPCPFCGRESKIEAFLVDDDPHWWYVATCVICPAKTYDQQTSQEAARIWNTRAPAPQPVLDAGEWQLHNDGSVRICLVLPDGNCKQIAEAEIIGWTREEALAHAAQIVSDHRSAAAVARLVQALKEARALIASPDELVRLVSQAPVLKLIDEALTTVQGKEQG
jgi:hypothetical protein